MIYSLSGRVAEKNGQFAVIEVGGIGFKVFSTQGNLTALPLSEDVHIFCHYYLREDSASLYGFLAAEELRIFEMLIAISGIGPKSALGILNVASPDKLLAAIKEGRVELLTKVSGVGRKTAERVILELRGKIESPQGEELVRAMESDADIEDALVNLGYGRPQIREAVKKIDPRFVKLEDRLRATLKILKK